MSQRKQASLSKAGKLPFTYPPDARCYEAPNLEAEKRTAEQIQRRYVGTRPRSPRPILPPSAYRRTLTELIPAPRAIS